MVHIHFDRLYRLNRCIADLPPLFSIQILGWRIFLWPTFKSLAVHIHKRIGLFLMTNCAHGAVARNELSLVRQYKQLIFYGIN